MRASSPRRRIATRASRPFRRCRLRWGWGSIGCPSSRRSAAVWPRKWRRPWRPKGAVPKAARAAKVPRRAAPKNPRAICRPSRSGGGASAPSSRTSSRSTSISRRPRRRRRPRSVLGPSGSVSPCSPTRHAASSMRAPRSRSSTRSCRSWSPTPSRERREAAPFAWPSRRIGTGAGWSSMTAARACRRAPAAPPSGSSARSTADRGRRSPSPPNSRRAKAPSSR